MRHFHVLQHRHKFPHIQPLSPDFRKVTELIQTEPASSAVAKIDSSIQVVVLQKGGSIFPVNVSVNPDT